MLNTSNTHAKSNTQLQIRTSSLQQLLSLLEPEISENPTSSLSLDVPLSELYSQIAASPELRKRAAALLYLAFAPQSINQGDIRKTRVDLQCRTGLISLLNLQTEDSYKAA